MENLAFYSEGTGVVFNDFSDFNYSDVKIVPSPDIGLFFDRDGVVNTDEGYSHNFKKVTIYPEFLELLDFAILEDFRFGIATNQSGVARGLYSWEQFFKFHESLDREIKYISKKGIDVIACGWHPEHSRGKSSSRWRKPKANTFPFFDRFK